MIALGMTNVEIGTELFLSVDTVKTYVRRLYAKLGVKNRAQAALHAAGHHVLPPATRQAHAPCGDACHHRLVATEAGDEGVGSVTPSQDHATGGLDREYAGSTSTLRAARATMCWTG